MQSCRHSILALSFALCVSAPAAAQSASSADAATAAARAALSPSLERLTLGNGLRVVMDPREATGVVSVCSVWGVGERDEAPGEAGYARLVEQLSRRSGEVEMRVAERGGSTRSATEIDRTVFCTTVPASEMPIAVWAEASRLQPLRTPAVLFEPERDRAIARLLPLGADASRARGEYLLSGLAFEGWWRSERTPESSLLDLTPQDLVSVGLFHDRYYRSDNVVFSFSGNLDGAAVRAEIDKQTSPAPPTGLVPRYVAPAPPPRQTSERFAALQDDGLGTPLVLFGYTIPGCEASDHRALELAAEVLGGGPSSVLHDQLVVRQRQARDVRGWTTPQRDVGALVLEVSLTKGATMKRVELVISQQLRRLRVAGPTQQELARARAGRVASLLDRVQTSEQRARLFGEWELVAGDARLLAKEPDAYRAITPGQVRQAMKEHVDPTIPSIVEVHPPGWYSPTDAKPPPRVHIVDRGETLIGIAKRYGITVNELTRKNGIQQSKPIYPGQTLKLPKGAKDSGSRRSGGSSRSAPPKPREHSVTKGESLSTIAHHYGVTTTALARANRLDPKRPIRIGQKLVIPPKAKPREEGKQGPSASTSKREPRSKSSQSGSASKTEPEATQEEEAPKPVRVHTVQKGQTLGGIAHANGVSTADLARYNGIDPKKPIRIGQKLKIPPPKPKR